MKNETAKRSRLMPHQIYAAGEFTADSCMMCPLKNISIDNFVVTRLPIHTCYRYHPHHLVARVRVKMRTIYSTRSIVVPDGGEVADFLVLLFSAKSPERRLSRLNKIRESKCMKSRA